MLKRRRRGDGRERIFDGHGLLLRRTASILFFSPSMGVVTLLVSGSRCFLRVLRSSRGGHYSPRPHRFAAKLRSVLREMR